MAIERVLRSQPVLRSPSQSSKPVLQLVSKQSPAWQTAVPFAAPQNLPHSPQFVFVLRDSQPSASLPLHSSKPSSQPISSQVPYWQLAMPLARMQATPQPLQSVSVVKAVSQPGSLVQSPKPGAQT